MLTNQINFNLIYTYRRCCSAKWTNYLLRGTDKWYATLTGVQIVYLTIYNFTHRSFYKLPLMKKQLNSLELQHTLITDKN